ncbi:MAG: serine hydrolase [Rheinheimera sp.]|nr:serine hydrolase [Rheinheimera sp.]
MTRLVQPCFMALLFAIFSVQAKALTDAITTALPPAFIEQTMHEAGVTGLAIAYLGDNQDIRGFGQTHPEGEPVTADTVFQVASLGKIALAYTAQLMIANGQLRPDQVLHDPRIKLAPNCPPPTVLTVLTHSSGLGNDLAASEFRPDCQTQSHFRYSGQGFLVLADEMARVSGKPVTTLIDELLFRPLAMTNSRFGPAINTENVATGQISATAFVLGQMLGNPFGLTGLSANSILILLLIVAPVFIGRRHGWTTGILTFIALLLPIILLALFAGTRISVSAQRTIPADQVPASLTSSARDMAILTKELLHPTLLTSSSLRSAGAGLSFAPQIKQSACIGWSLLMGTDSCGETFTAWQWGSNLGFQSLLVIAPDSGKAVIILTNSGGGLDAILPGQGGYPAARKIAAALLQINGQWTLQ